MNNVKKLLKVLAVYTGTDGQAQKESQSTYHKKKLEFVSHKDRELILQTRRHSFNKDHLKQHRAVVNETKRRFSTFGPISALRLWLQKS